MLMFCQLLINSNKDRQYGTVEREGKEDTDSVRGVKGLDPGFFKHLVFDSI